jgi:hypothetical protein
MPFTLTRSLIVVLVPGLVATAPWILLIAIYFPQALHAYDTRVVAGNALMFAFVVVVGSVLEGIGSNLEVKWDKERDSDFDVQENWYKYLALTPSAEPVGFRYISRIVTTLYFELAMSIAGPSMLIGIAFLIAPYEQPLAIWRAVLAALLVVLAWFAYRVFKGHAHDTHLVLCKVRREIVERLGREVALAAKKPFRKD